MTTIKDRHRRPLTSNEKDLVFAALEELQISDRPALPAKKRIIQIIRNMRAERDDTAQSATLAKLADEMRKQVTATSDLAARKSQLCQRLPYLLLLIPNNDIIVAEDHTNIIADELELVELLKRSAILMAKIENLIPRRKGQRNFHDMIHGKWKQRLANNAYSLFREYRPIENAVPGISAYRTLTGYLYEAITGESADDETGAGIDKVCNRTARYWQRDHKLKQLKRQLRNPELPDSDRKKLEALIAKKSAQLQNTEVDQEMQLVSEAYRYGGTFTYHRAAHDARQCRRQGGRGREQHIEHGTGFAAAQEQLARLAVLRIETNRRVETVASPARMPRRSKLWRPEVCRTVRQTPNFSSASSPYTTTRPDSAPAGHPGPAALGPAPGRTPIYGGWDGRALSANARNL